MSAAGEDHDVMLTGNIIDQSVFPVDLSAPAISFVAQRFRVADTVKAAALDIPQQLIDPAQRLLVLRLPVEIFVPGNG